MKAAAARRVVEEKARKALGKVWDPEAAAVVDPVAGLQQLTGSLRNAADVLGARVEADDFTGPIAAAWLRVLGELRTALTDMQRLGIADRQLELQQATAELVFAAFESALAAVPELLPDAKQRAIVAFLGGLGRGDVVTGELV